MHTVLINGRPARTAQEIVNAIHFAPELVAIESGPEISADAYDGTLQALSPHSHILFIAADGTIGEIHVNATGGHVVEVMLPVAVKGGKHEC